MIIEIVSVDWELAKKLQPALKNPMDFPSISSRTLVKRARFTFYLNNSNHNENGHELRF